MAKNKHPNYSQPSEEEIRSRLAANNEQLGETLLDIESSKKLLRAGAIGTRAYEDNEQYNTLRKEALMKNIDDLTKRLAEIALSGRNKQ